MLKLCSVGFIREANNIGTVIDQTDFVILAVAEFLNGTDIESTAFTRAEFFAELFTGGNNAYFAKIQKLLTLGK